MKELVIKMMQHNTKSKFLANLASEFKNQNFAIIVY